MSYLLIAIVAYSLIALNSALDKIILNKSVPHPVVYCFYMGVLSIFGVAFAPFGRFWINTEQALLGLLVGAIFMVALFLLYRAVFSGEASRVGPMIGGLTPIFVSILSFFFLGERLDSFQLLAFVFLVAGGLLIAWNFESNSQTEAGEKKRQKVWQIIKMSLLASLVFGIYYVLLKHTYNHQNFVAGFVWTRLGSFLATFLLLIPSKNRQLIRQSFGQSHFGAGALVLFNKSLSGFSFAILNYAITIGSITIINALQGVQYVFLLVWVLLFSKLYPKILKEGMDRKILTQKIAAIALIIVGLVLIALF